MLTLDELDRKATQVFAGRVVRKDLVRQVKVGANVPTYVLEYLLGKYCATDDPVAVEAGLRMVHNTLADHIIRPDEAMKAQSRVKERGQQRYIDKVLVRLDGTNEEEGRRLLTEGAPDNVVVEATMLSAAERAVALAEEAV